MSPYLGETIYLDLPPLVHPTTKVASDADETPTAQVYEDANDTPILTPTVVKRSGTTGRYRVPLACTEDNGFEDGKTYNVYATATVAGTTGSALLGRFQVRADASVSAWLGEPIPIRNQDSVADPAVDGHPTVGDALLAAWCEAFGKHFRTGSVLVYRRPDSSVPVRTVQFNSPTNATSRS
jgi:hypothetical protein